MIETNGLCEKAKRIREYVEKGKELLNKGGISEKELRLSFDITMINVNIMKSSVYEVETELKILKSLPDTGMVKQLLNEAEKTYEHLKTISNDVNELKDLIKNELIKKGFKVNEEYYISPVVDEISKYFSEDKGVNNGKH